MDFLAVLAPLPGILGLFLLVIGVPALIRSLREFRHAKVQQQQSRHIQAV